MFYVIVLKYTYTLAQWHTDIHVGYWLISQGEDCKLFLFSKNQSLIWCILKRRQNFWIVTRIQTFSMQVTASFVPSSSSIFDTQALEKLLKIMSSSNHSSSTFWTITDHSITSVAHKMTLSALENFTVSSVTFITNWTLWSKHLNSIWEKSQTNFYGFRKRHS